MYAVSGLMIASCKIDGTGNGSDGIDIVTSDTVPSPANPGHPEKISGTLLIMNNDIDLAGGMAGDQTVGVLVFSVGVASAEVEAYVSGNTIRNTTEPAIDFRRIVGRAYIERNVITTGSVSTGTPQAIRVVNTGW